LGGGGIAISWAVSPWPTDNSSQLSGGRDFALVSRFVHCVEGAMLLFSVLQGLVLLLLPPPPPSPTPGDKKHTQTLHGTAPSCRSYIWVQLWENHQVRNHSYADSSVSCRKSGCVLVCRPSRGICRTQQGQGPTFRYISLYILYKYRIHADQLMFQIDTPL